MAKEKVSQNGVGFPDLVSASRYSLRYVPATRRVFKQFDGHMGGSF